MRCALGRAILTPLPEILPEFYGARALVMDGDNLAGQRAKREACG